MLPSRVNALVPLTQHFLTLAEILTYFELVLPSYTWRCQGLNLGPCKLKADVPPLNNGPSPSLFLHIKLNKVRNAMPVTGKAIPIKEYPIVLTEKRHSLPHCSNIVAITLLV